MGFEINRFVGDVDDLVLCKICFGVLQNPVEVNYNLFMPITFNTSHVCLQHYLLLHQVPGCQHVFCKKCISQLLSKQHQCPVDNVPVLIDQLRPPPKVLQILLSRFVDYIILILGYTKIGFFLIYRLETIVLQTYFIYVYQVIY